MSLENFMWPPFLSSGPVRLEAALRVLLNGPLGERGDHPRHARPELAQLAGARAGSNAHGGGT